MALTYSFRYHVLNGHFKIIDPNGVMCMPQQPVSPEPGRDEDPGRAEEDWLAWCEALEASGQPLDPDEEEPDEDDAPWDADLDAIIAECRQVTAEEAAFAAQAARRGAARVGGAAAGGVPERGGRVRGRDAARHDAGVRGAGRVRRRGGRG